MLFKNREQIDTAFIKLSLEFINISCYYNDN